MLCTVNRLLPISIVHVVPDDLCVVRRASVHSLIVTMRNTGIGDYRVRQMRE